MNDDIENQASGLDPLDPEAQWPPDPDATTVTVAPASPGDGPPPKPSWKAWVAVGAAAALVGAGAVLGINAATSSGSSNASVSTEDGTGATGDELQTQGGPPGFAGRPGGAGTITTIDGSTLTIEDQSGDSTEVLTNASTEVTQSVIGTVDDIKVGDTVMVVGTGTSTEIAATTVNDDGVVPSDRDTQGELRNGNGPPDGGAGQGPERRVFGGEVPGGDSDASFTRGVVQSIGDGTFTVTSLEELTVTVTTSSSTEVTVAKAAKVADLEVGDQVIVQGDESGGTITATSIREGTLGRFRDGPPPGANGGSTSSDDASQ